MRLIDADVLKEDLTRFYDGEVTARQLIDAQPTVQPAPPEPCEDAVSRQAAIDVVGDWIYNPEDLRYHKDVINSIPAVQPEIIRCKDCDWWTKQEDSVQGRCELMQMYPAGEWYCGNARRRLE